MRRLFIILGIISSILAVVISVTPLSKIAFIPGITALVFGVIAFYFSRQKQYPKKTIQLIFLLTIISLVITTYRAVFDTVEMGDIKNLKVREKESKEKAIEELESLDLDDFEGIELLDSIQ